ncbi:Cytochrome P454 monooxygenase [Paramyrothecium foliicola]|nr:Cytochrome P454 monooxygenase [Paramyrothecium foliicola]
MLLWCPLPAAAILLLFLSAAYLVRCFLSPLRALPGPFTSKFTSATLKWNELKANRTLYIHKLHQQYGPVVRIAPNEVSFTSEAALKEIYCSGGSGYEKTEFYDLFTLFGRRTMFTMLYKADHARRKRLLADRYANSNIMKSASLAGVKERSTRFVERCVKSKNGIADIFMALHAYACDCVTHHLFHPYGTDCLRKTQDEEMMHQVAADDSLQNRLISHYSPTVHRLLDSILSLVAKPRQTPLADNYVLEASKRSDVAAFTLMSRLEQKNEELEPVDMAAECLDHMAAGIDTTGDGLCFLMWELSQPRSLRFQHKLREELRRHRDVPFDQLAYLDAVICEGLRCFPPIPMSLPRYVPSGGRTIDGFFLPEKTIVSCQAFSVHRINTAVFPDPDTFDPERWLSSDGDAARRRLLFSFSSGGRGCVGKHLALVEMKTLLRDVYAAFQTTPDPSMTEESMAISDQLISSRPLGQRCLLRFEPIETEEHST